MSRNREVVRRNPAPEPDRQSEQAAATPAASVEECLEYASANPQSVRWTDGLGIELPDGRYAILGGGNPSTGIWFLRGQDGQPDLNQRIDVEAELNKVGRTLKPPER